MQTKLKFMIAASAALACATAANAQSAGDFILNAGWTYIVPNKTSMNFSEVGLEADVKGKTASAFGLSGTYFITDNVAADLALSTPTRITLKGNKNIGSFETFSPTLSLKYYFLDAADKFRPYVGVGVSHVSFKKAHVRNEISSIASFDFKNKWAPVANAGFTYQFTEQLFGGVSVSYMPVKAGKVTITHPMGVASSRDYKFDPITTFVSLGYKF